MTENTIETQPTIRDFEVSQAVRFLQDKRVRDAPISQKQTFLKTKGLTDSEVSNAIARADAAAAFTLPDQSGSLTAGIGILGGLISICASAAYLYKLWKDYQNNQSETFCEEKVVKQPENENNKSSEVVNLLRQVIVNQERIHKEQSTLLKGLTVIVSELSNRKKIAGSICVADALIEKESEPLPPVSQEMIADVLDSSCLPTLLMVLNNLVQYPDEERYRKISLTNARFKKQLGEGCGFEILKCVGFQVNKDFMILPKERDVKPIEQLLVDLDMSKIA